MKFLIVYCVVVLTWILLSIIGALGPNVNVVEEFGLKKCIVGADHISDEKLPMITSKNCETHGMLIQDIESDKLKRYRSYDVIFFVTLPVKQTHRKMSRLYQYLIVDIDVSLRSDYIKKLTEKYNHQLLEYHISLGYRDDDDQHWSRLASGNASRLLDCSQSQWGTYSCNHFPLFELWSCHHEHYLINLRFPLFPLTDKHLEEFRGISAIKDMSIIEIHQHPAFTDIWFVTKGIFFCVSLLMVIIYRNALAGYTLYLALCLLFVNAPFELFTLWFDMPWMVVFNDFRHGLMMGFLCIYWTSFISQIDNTSKNLNQSLSQNWCSVVLIMVACVTLFIYEFCERGIQVIMPFYSFWGTPQGKYISYAMIGIATTSAALFVASLLGKLVKLFLKIRSMYLQVSSTRTKAKEQLWELLGFVLLTTSVCAFSILGYIIPMEVYLLHWAHDNHQLSLYGALLMSNYGLWNVYVFAVIVLYSKIKSNVKLIDKTSS